MRDRHLRTLFADDPARSDPTLSIAKRYREFADPFERANTRLRSVSDRTHLRHHSSKEA
jgi:hypothetical protein